jgi:hypothetical protein
VALRGPKSAGFARNSVRFGALDACRILDDRQRIFLAYLRLLLQSLGAACNVRQSAPCRSADTTRSLLDDVRHCAGLRQEDGVAGLDFGHLRLCALVH